MTRKVYVLVLNVKEDPRTLPEGELVYIFRFLKGQLNIPYIWAKLGEVLSKATDQDLIVFNGPGVVKAIAGYYWFTNGKITRFNTLTFNMKQQKYELNTDLIPDLPSEHG